MNGHLVEAIGMVPPPGIGLDGKILRLDKALYGLTQAQRAWLEKLSDPLAEIGFISLPFDPYVLISADHRIIVVVYVDDITSAGSRADINPLIDHLRSRFKVTVKGRLKYILGIEIKHTPEGMELSQHQYITNILSHFEMESRRPVSTPVDAKTCLVKASDADPVFEQNLYQRMIGSLIHLITCTRPDLAFSVSHLSRFTSHPLEHHYTAVKAFGVVLPSLILCLLSTSVLLLQFLCLFLPSLTLIILLVVIPVVPYLVTLSC